MLLMKHAAPTLAFFGHHKCGTTWIMRVVRRVCQHMGLRHGHVHSPKMFGYDPEKGYTLDKAVIDLNLDFVSYTGADIKYVGDINRYRGVHVIRDPRDIVVSAYFSHRYSHPTKYWPELVGFRKVLEGLPKDEGLLASMEFTAKLRVDGWDLDLFDSLMDWDYSLPNIMEVKFEDLVGNPYKVFVHIFDFLGIVDYTGLGVLQIFRQYMRDRLQRVLGRSPFRWRSHGIPDWLLLYFVYLNNFSRLAGGRKQGQENIESHFRKGVPGDWKSHFNTKHKEFFKQHFNSLLIKLGYETDDNW